MCVLSKIMLIGITGSIGSGKSVVLDIIKSLGYETYDCDKITLLAYEDTYIKEKLLIAFNVASKDKIKEILNGENIKKLNDIIHPFVINYLINLKNNATKKLIFVETPLLYELKLDNLFDKVIAVYASDKIRNERLLKRNKDTYLKMKELEKFQLSQNEKKEKADFIIDNSIDLEKVIIQIKNIIDLLKNLN